MKGVKLDIGYWALGIGKTLPLSSPVPSPQFPIIDTQLGDGYYQPTG
ncbi:hypothetical protein [Nostoc sp. LPT]|nr:hypothetical protein [Nostoc sp. LPT]MBN4004661.1 hypothetical protein [Nostoc sp. LPT]